MIHNENTTDCYDFDENDPLLTHAAEGSLWELLLLKNHYNAKVVELVKEFEKPIEKVPRISPAEIEILQPEALPYLNIKEFKPINII
jgi:CBF/Mak21 family.